MNARHFSFLPMLWRPALLGSVAIFSIALVGPARAQAPSAAPSTSARFEQANRAFAEGHYAAAVAGFEGLARTRGWSAPLLYDLGNAYAQEGHVGRSILSYERARVLAPRDADITANLAYVRARAGLPSPSPTWYQVVVSRLSPTAWTWFAAGSLWLVGLCLMSARKWHLRGLGYAAVVTFLLTATSVAGVVVSARAANRAVVVESKSAPVRVSPFDSATSDS
jgi:tetratricopeptide (TPR) repeat protein